MADRISDYTLSCPCKGVIIEGDMIQVHGEAGSLPGVGAHIGCPCGCLHRVAEIDEAARLVVVVALDHDEQLTVYAELGFDMVKVGCPHCDAVHATEVPGEIDPIGLVVRCFSCYKVFAIVDRDERELRTRALTDDESAYVRRQAQRAARLRAFGGFATGATPFGSDPFGSFGRGGAS